MHDEKKMELGRSSLLEVKQDVDRIQDHLSKQDEHLTEQDRVIGKMMASQARVEGQVEILLRAFERLSNLELKHTEVALEVRKTGQISAIRETELSMQHRRGVSMRWLTVGTGVLAAIGSALTTRC